MRRLVSAIAMLWVCCSAAGVRADVPPADVEFCGGKSAGTACQTEDGKSGACGNGTCYRARPEGSSAYDCYRCVEGATPAATTTKGACAGGADAAGGAVLAAALGMAGWRGRRRCAR